jgi:hypothetical protein
VERRAGQRFDYQIPISIRVGANPCAASGFTQDLSAKGVNFYTDVALVEGESIELTLVMPSEITLGESMRVKCQGSVLRVLSSGGQKFAIAARLNSYEYLEESVETPADATGSSNLPERSPEDDCVSSHTFDFRGASGR